MTNLAKCRAPRCGGDLELLLDAGTHPVSNGYIREGQTASNKPIQLGRCQRCGLLQLPSTFAETDLAAVVPDWVRYSEPEAHLDEVAALLEDLMAGDCGRGVAGLTYIDHSLQERLRQKGWANQAEIDVLSGVDGGARCGIERMLAEVSRGRWDAGGRKFDLILARHVFDHTRDTAVFLNFIRSRLSERGMVLIEVPNAIGDLESGNPLMLWESHANYFTPATLHGTLERSGFRVETSREFAIGVPSMLVTVCSVGKAMETEAWADASPELLRQYADRFAPNRVALAEKLAELRARHGTVAMLGAGHIGNLFLNLHGLGGFLDCALDDDERKSGLLLPGSGLPIRAGSAMAGVADLFILMAVNPAAEERVIERWRQQNPSAVFGSIFSQSPRYVLKL